MPRRFVLSGRIRTLAALVAVLFVTSATAAPGTADRGTPPVPAPVVAGIDLERATIPDLQRAMDTGRLSSVRLTAFYLQRIRVLNPTLHAVIATNPDALRLAAASDARRHRHGPRGQMEGIPVLLKDNIDTADRQQTTAGSFALAGARPARDAHLVHRLRSAGAVILGKANLSEWANFRSSMSTSGWSAVGGQTANPYVLDRNPCGSSSGSAVAVSAHLATVAVGTETDGSIVCPSGATGIVGVKPSIGLVSRAGVVPISAAQDTAGPMARNVTDAAILLAAMNGPDRRDESTVDGGAHALADYTRFLRPHALRGKRIGVWRDAAGGASPAADAALDRAVGQLRGLGASTVDISIPYRDIVNENEFPALLTEFKHDINAYLAATPGEHPRDLAGLIEFNRANAAREMPFFAQEVFEQAQATTGDLSDPEYRRVRAAATGAARRGLDEVLGGYRLDAIVAPTNSPAWNTTLGSGDAFLFGSAGMAAVSGYANLTVPMAYSGALPLGMSIMGGRFSEPTLLAVAYAFEQGTKVRQPPRFLPTVG
ncbi:amidase [Actinokineospora sp.]|uniref:amidase n=1 Tax=Actinokineospora sp. TaxID=1872133 RepID=UPI0040376D4B